MPQVIQLSDGSAHTIFGEMDILSLIDERMGVEARLLIEEMLTEHGADNAQIDDLEHHVYVLSAHHYTVMQSLRKQSETIAKLIREKDIDRKALSTAAGMIGIITWREMNRGTKMADSQTDAHRTGGENVDS